MAIIHNEYKDFVVPKDMKPHIASISYRGKVYMLVILRPDNEEKVTVTLDDFRAAYPEMDIRVSDTFTIG